MEKSVNARNISCEEAITLIARQLDKSADDLERSLLERHIETCRHCFNRMEFERLLKSRLAGLRLGEVSESLRTKVDSVLDRF